MIFCISPDLFSLLDTTSHITDINPESQSSKSSPMPKNHSKSTAIPDFVWLANKTTPPIPKNQFKHLGWTSFPLILFFLLLITSSRAETRTAATSGNWSSGDTWEGAVVPVATDDVTIPIGVTVTLDAATSCKSLNLSGTLDLNGSTFSTGAFSGNGTLTNGAELKVFTTGADNTNTEFSGQINGTLSLTKIGTGSFTLSGMNTYNGNTTLLSGTLNINHPSAIGIGNFTISGGTIDNTSGSSITLSTNNLISWNGNFSFGGTNDLNFGTGEVSISANRTIILEGSNNDLTFGGILRNMQGGSPIITIIGEGSTLILEGLILSNTTASRTVTFAGSANTTISGLVSNGEQTSSCNLTYSGKGKLTLIGSNTYSGTTEVISGTLAIGNNQALGTSKLNLGGGSSDTPTLIATGSDQIISNNINLLATSVKGNPTIGGANNLTINGIVTSSGSSRTLTILNSGTTTLNGRVYLSDPTTTITSRTLTINGNGILSINGVIANMSSSDNPENLAYSGSGKLILTGANTYSGLTTISSGEVCLNPTADHVLRSSFVLNGGKLGTLEIISGRNISTTGTLTLTANSTIDLGANQHTLKFADSHGATWTGERLTIHGWSATGGKIYFGTNASGLTTAQLSKIIFDGYPGTPVLTSYGELVPSTISWTGTVDSVWTNSGNWSYDAVPNATTDIRIPSGLTNYPVISAGSTADCHHLYMPEGATLTIESDGSGSGSLIMHGSFTGPGKVTYNRHMTDRWHLVSSPVAAAEDQSVSGFLANASNSIYRPTDPTANQYEMVIYKEEDNIWEYYENELGTGKYFGLHPNFQNGAGYGLLRSSEGTVSFTGSLNNSDISVPMVKSGDGWNMVGNPFTSAIKANNASGDASNNFLQINAGNLEDNYAAIYVWEEGSGYDGETNYFKVITNAVPYGDFTPSQNFIQAGQGFFVKAESNGGSILFKRAMQSHSIETPLKSATLSNWYGLQLNVKATDIAAHTIVSFNTDMTKGLDVTYDAGLLRSGNGLEVYSRLVDDNGVDFAVQALPLSGMDKVPIPLGVDFEAGGTLEFSASAISFSNDATYFLEDKVTGSLTDLKSDVYSVSLPANTKGTGRFFLYASAADITGTDSFVLENQDVSVWLNDGFINIQGDFDGCAKAKLYDVCGKLLFDLQLNDTELNRLPAHHLVKGIYFLHVADKSRQTTKKVILN